jgi:hypothetical protein
MLICDVPIQFDAIAFFGVAITLYVFFFRWCMKQHTRIVTGQVTAEEQRRGREALRKLVMYGSVAVLTWHWLRQADKKNYYGGHYRRRDTWGS